MAIRSPSLIIVLCTHIVLRKDAGPPNAEEKKLTWGTPASWAQPSRTTFTGICCQDKNKRQRASANVGFGHDTGVVTYKIYYSLIHICNFIWYLMSKGVACRSSKFIVDHTKVPLRILRTYSPHCRLPLYAERIKVVERAYNENYSFKTLGLCAGLHIFPSCSMQGALHRQITLSCLHCVSVS